MNKFLNTETALSQQPSRHKIHYTHPKERDAFFLLPPHFALPPWAAHFVAERGRGPKLRVTTDLKTGRVKACIVKIRVADLNVYSPLTPFDWRVSVNIELPLSPADFLSNGSGPPPSQEAPSEEQEQQFLAQLEPDQDAQVRVKDRMQYRHLIYTVDLTQVTLPDGAKVHECEIEADAERVLREADRARRGEGNEFERAVGGLVANLRVMCRAGGY
ncbi:CYTH-like domain-containing protein [Lineolata rhizophorae]|uniref:mRNA-capping enzyme subunit beta n=1 Tax=Lineolata rhizophorae TaxID=578093 RepID=A0A6A6NQT1_9PEZI|nr:CYTH-like domain-containing protein [Lineolata rhizophorae]